MFSYLVILFDNIIDILAVFLMIRNLYIKSTFNFQNLNYLNFIIKNKVSSYELKDL
jgi:hypothetical protein